MKCPHCGLDLSLQRFKVRFVDDDLEVAERVVQAYDADGAVVFVNCVEQGFRELVKVEKVKE